MRQCSHHESCRMWVVNRACSATGGTPRNMRQCEWVVVFVSVLPKAVQTCSLHVLHLSQVASKSAKFPGSSSRGSMAAGTSVGTQPAQPDHTFVLSPLSTSVVVNTIAPCSQIVGFWCPSGSWMYELFPPTPNTTCTLMLVNTSTQRMGLTTGATSNLKR